MTWTNKNPKVPGWYWYKDNLTDQEGVILKVTVSEGILFAHDEEICFQFKPGSKADKETAWGDQPIPEPTTICKLSKK